MIDDGRTVSAGFGAEVVDLEGIRIVRLRGELDLSGRPQMQCLCDRLLAAGVPTVVLELCELRFVDGRGVQGWMELAAQLRNRGGELVLRNPAGIVRRLVELTKVGEVARVEYTTDGPSDR